MITDLFGGRGPLDRSRRRGGSQAEKVREAERSAEGADA